MTTADPLNIVLAYRTPNPVEARTLANYLVEAGVETKVVGDFFGGAFTGLKLGRMGEQEVWVAAQDETAASAVVAAWRQEHPDNFQASRPMPLSHRVMWTVALMYLLLIGFGGFGS